MRPKTVWLFELLDTWKACGTKEGMFTARRKKLLAEWRFFRIDANVPFPHVYFGKQLQLTHKAQVRIRWKWPPRYTGKPQDDIEIKNAGLYWTASYESEITIKRNREKKEKGCAIPEQDKVRHLFKPESSAGAGQMTVFIPVDWITCWDMEWPCSVVRCEQPSPVAHLSATRLFDVQHRSEVQRSMFQI